MYTPYTPRVHYTSIYSSCTPHVHPIHSSCTLHFHTLLMYTTLPYTLYISIPLHIPHSEKLLRFCGYCGQCLMRHQRSICKSFPVKITNSLLRKFLAHPYTMYPYIRTHHHVVAYTPPCMCPHIIYPHTLSHTLKLSHTLTHSHTPCTPLSHTLTHSHTLSHSHTLTYHTSPLSVSYECHQRTGGGCNEPTTPDNQNTLCNEKESR